MKTILVTGGTGFIGNCFCKLLLEERPEYRVVNVDVCTYAANPSTIKEELKNPNYVFYKEDIRDREKMDEIFNKEHPDVVVNFAAESHVDRSILDPESFLTTNIIGTSVLMDCCRKYGIERYHQVSTDEVYGDLPLDRPDLFFHEDTPLHRATFMKSQNLYAMRNPRNGPLQYPYYGFLKCPCCGKNMVNVYVGGSINANAWTCGGEGLQTKLQDRSNCPTYLLQDDVLTRTLMGYIRKLDPYAEANCGFARPICDAQNIIGQQGKIVYSILSRLVESITLEDWQHLRVCWRMGYSSVCPIEYNYLREVILPIITVNDKGRNVCFGNFVQCKDKFLEAFQRRQQRVLQYEVVKSLYSNCQVPKLISPEQQRKDRCMHGN